MLKKYLQIAAALIFSFSSALSFAQQCAMKNLPVTCEKGEKIQLDVIRTYDQRGDVFLKINASKAIGDYVLLYINSTKPEILKMQRESASQNSKGAYIPRDVIGKLKSANSVQFKIAMKSGTPLLGSLNQNHFEWLKRFGQACS